MAKVLFFLLIFCGNVVVFSTYCFASNVVFSKIIPRENGCVWFYGSYSFGGDEFFIEDCGSSIKHIRTFNVGYIKQLQFINGEDAWGIIGSSLVKVRYRNSEFLAEVKIKEPAKGGFEDVVFTDENRGWAVGENGLIVKTSDGGVTWQKLESNTEAKLSEIHFANKDFGWILRKGEDSQFSHLETWDGGNTWKKITLPQNRILSPLYFSSDIQGCGLASRVEFFCTNDGINWISKKMPSENYSDIVFSSHGVGWVVGSTIKNTTDGGKTWKQVFPKRSSKSGGNSDLALDEMFFLDEQTGWARGLRSIYKTLDGGITWISISSDFKEVLEKSRLAELDEPLKVR